MRQGHGDKGFPQPLFDGVFTIVDQRLVANKHLKMLLKSQDELISAIAFYVDLTKWPNYRCERVHIAYRIDRNEFRGKRTVQLIVEHAKAVNVG